MKLMTVRISKTGVRTEVMRFEVAICRYMNDREATSRHS